MPVKTKKAVKEEMKPEPKDEASTLDSEPESDSGSESESEDERSKKRKTSKKAAAPPTKKAKSSGGDAKKTVVSRGPDKNNMAYNKGDYVIRLSDLEEGKIQIWRVDNYQLLQKYLKQDEDDNTKYQRTQYYTGWQCHQKWKFLAVQVTNMERMNGKEEKVDIRYPSQKEIDKAKKECEEHDDE